MINGMPIEEQDVEWLKETLDNLFTEASVAQNQANRKQASLNMSLDKGAFPIGSPMDIEAREDIAREKAALEGASQAYDYLIEFARPWFDISVDQHGNHIVKVRQP